MPRTSIQCSGLRTRCHGTICGAAACPYRWPLEKPVVVETMVVSKLVFIELSVRDSAITRFLTGMRYQVVPMRDVKVLDRLMDLRNQATCREISKFKGGEESVVEDLGLDAPKVCAPRRSILETMGPTIVDVDCDGTKLKLLGELGTRRVWMELTSENMKFLFDQVSAELGQAAAAEPRAKARSRGSDASGDTD